MSDLELLKLAARAAGIAHVTPMMIEWGKWDPLNDGDDALRLAVALRIHIHHHDLSPIVSAAADGFMWIDVPYGDDAHVATRRAIVLAAAQIGREMTNE